MLFWFAVYIIPYLLFMTWRSRLHPTKAYEWKDSIQSFTHLHNSMQHQPGPETIDIIMKGSVMHMPCMGHAYAAL